MAVGCVSDRLQEIRARLDAATPGLDGRLRRVQPTPQPWGPPLTYEVDKPNADLIAHAPTDIAWLLAEVQRLRNTKVSASNPLCDGSDDD